jgi:hypothetical protein
LLCNEVADKLDIVGGDLSLAVCEYLGHVITMTDFVFERNPKI